MFFYATFVPIVKGKHVPSSQKVTNDIFRTDIAQNPRPSDLQSSDLPLDHAQLATTIIKTLRLNSLKWQYNIAK